MKISDTTRNERIIKTVLTEAEIGALCVEHVLNEAGVMWRDGVKPRTYLTTRDTSTGIEKEMNVEIVIDLSLLPESSK